MESKEEYAASNSDKRINFASHNKDEDLYLESLKRLLDVKRRGDWILVAEMLGISAKNAELSFARIYSKHHNQVVEALSNVIENRRKLLKKL